MVWKLVDLLVIFGFLLFVVVIRHFLKCKDLVGDLIGLRWLYAFLLNVGLDCVLLGVCHRVLLLDLEMLEHLLLVKMLLDDLLG